MILDCCHSGGANRENPGTDWRARQYPNLPPMFSNLDPGDTTDTQRSATLDSKGMNLDSHVCIAACSSNQTAGECRLAPNMPSRGIFTQAMTAFLREKPENIYTTTYHSIINSIVAMINTHADHTL